MWLKWKSTMVELYWRVSETEKCCLCTGNSYGRCIETKIELNLILTRQSRHLQVTGDPDSSGVSSTTGSGFTSSVSFSVFSTGVTS
uniref:Uncharacterized protein n=1 Tax=Nelumbo nucifera TaxID=4432 RepID=A0A822XXT7_NELNU|nr:TPA_asm: hypothetical protein HUJ06_025038 [Nelumbo nucifera]